MGRGGRDILDYRPLDQLGFNIQLFSVYKSRARTMVHTLNLMWCPFSLREKEVALFNLVPNRLVAPNKTKRKKEVGLEIQFQEKEKCNVC